LAIIKKLDSFFSKIGHDISLFNPKPSLIVSGITLCLGIISWLIGGSTDKAMVFFMFPRSAIPLWLMYFLWGVSFAFLGIIIGGLLFGCEKYKKKDSLKTVIFAVFSLFFTYCVYSAFFRSLSPFFAFLLIFVAEFFCFLAIMSAIRSHALWSICLILNLLWLFYNSYVSIAISFIN
jgi:tryptophan-rich sensory protein